MSHLKKIAVMTAAIALLASAAATASAGAATCVSAGTPYRHTRITGQKMVYAHGTANCAVGNLHVSAQLYKWNGATWEKYGSPATSVSDALANEFLCSNYGWGGSGSGYFA